MTVQETTTTTTTTTTPADDETMKIASFIPAGTEMVYLLGLQDNLVGE